MGELDYVLGIVAGEGCFTVGHKIQNGHIYINPAFLISLKKKDADTLEVVKNVFDGRGSISVNGDMATWRISGKDNFKFITKTIRENASDAWWKSEKAKNFKLWAEIIDIYTDGYNNSDDTAEMFRIAEDLNKGNGKEVDFTEKVKIAENDSYGHTCGYIKSDGEPCQRRVPVKDETCWDH